MLLFFNSLFTCSSLSYFKGKIWAYALISCIWNKNESSNQIMYHWVTHYYILGHFQCCYCLAFVEDNTYISQKTWINQAVVDWEISCMFIADKTGWLLIDLFYWARISELLPSSHKTQNLLATSIPALMVPYSPSQANCPCGFSNERRSSPW